LDPYQLQALRASIDRVQSEVIAAGAISGMSKGIDQLKRVSRLRSLHGNAADWMLAEDGFVWFLFAQQLRYGVIVCGLLRL
jgi:hypothetical protein